MFFWNSLAFSMIQRMLAIWSLPFLNLAYTSGSSWFMYCWSPAWRILSITLLACEMSAIECYFENSLALPFFGVGKKSDLFQSCGHCCVFQFAGMWSAALSSMTIHDCRKQIKLRVCLTNSRYCGYFIFTKSKTWTLSIPLPPSKMTRYSQAFILTTFLSILTSILLSAALPSPAEPRINTEWTFIMSKTRLGSLSGLSHLIHDTIRSILQRRELRLREVN